MSEISALQKHACPACGAQAEWQPTKQLLVCPFCGTQAPYVFDDDTGKVKELDLSSALREVPREESGWQEERRSVQCQSCKAVMVYEPARVGQNCEFCGSPALVGYDAIKSPIRPQGVIPFKVPESQIRDAMRKWYSGRWFAPGALTRRALVDQVKSVYIPYWTFDAQVRCPWTAEAGHYYYVTEQFRDSKGQQQTRQVRKVRWEPASGSIDHFFDDEPVPGTRGVDLELLREVEPFPTGEAAPYDTGYLSGHLVEHYQVVLVDAVKRSREQMHSRLTELCSQQVPGDTHRNLKIDPRYTGETFKHVLVPIWLLTYTYGSKAFQVIVNGWSGTIAGRYPKSVWKILGVVALVLLVLGIVLSRN